MKQWFGPPTATHLAKQRRPQHNWRQAWPQQILWCAQILRRIKRTGRFRAQHFLSFPRPVCVGFGSERYTFIRMLPLFSNSSTNSMQGRVHYHNGFWIGASQLMTELFVWHSLSFPCGTPQSSIWQILNDFAERLVVGLVAAFSVCLCVMRPGIPSLGAVGQEDFATIIVIAERERGGKAADAH
jgi:hypothetical protein